MKDDRLTKIFYDVQLFQSKKNETIQNNGNVN